MNPFPLLVGLSIASTGLFLLGSGSVYAYHFWKRRRFLSGPLQTSLGSISEAGPVFLEGTIGNPDGTAGPTLSSQADHPVISIWEVRHRRRFLNRKLIGDRWVFNGLDATAFDLEAGEGSIRVDVPNSRPGIVHVSRLLSVGTAGVVTRDTVAALDSFPTVDSKYVTFSGPEGGYLTGKPRLKRHMTWSEPPGLVKRYFKPYYLMESVFEPGDRVTVLGYVRRAPGVREPSGIEDLVVSDFPDGSGKVYVTTKSRERLREDAKNRLLLGLVGVLAGLVVLAVAGEVLAYA